MKIIIYVKTGCPRCAGVIDGRILADSDKDQVAAYLKAKSVAGF